MRLLENMIVVSPSANGKLTPNRLKPEMLDAVSMVVMQLEIPLETVETVAKAAFERQIPVLHYDWSLLQAIVVYT